MKLVKTHRKSGDSAHVHESVTETDLVPSLVCLLFVRSSSVSPASRLQVSVSGFAPTHRDKGDCLGHNMARLGVTAELFGGAVYATRTHWAPADGVVECRMKAC